MDGGDSFDALPRIAAVVYAFGVAGVHRKQEFFLNKFRPQTPSRKKVGSAAEA